MTFPTVFLHLASFALPASELSFVFQGRTFTALPRSGSRDPRKGRNVAFEVERLIRKEWERKECQGRGLDESRRKDNTTTERSTLRVCTNLCAVVTAHQITPISTDVTVVVVYTFIQGFGILFFWNDTLPLALLAT